MAESWRQYLLPSVQAVQQKAPIPYSLELLYRKVEDACMHKHAPELYAQLEKACDSHVQDLVKQLCDPVLDASAFLRVVDDTWQRHCVQMLRIRAIFLKLDRAYIVPGGQQNTRSLWDMGLQQFRAHLVAGAGVLDRIVNALVGLINKERDGETVDQSRLRSLVRMLAAIYTYSDTFEEPFLSSTSDYYLAESNRLIAELDVPTYLSHVEKRIARELERASDYLDVNTRKCLMAIVEKRLIVDHCGALLDKGFAAMCDEGRLQDLKRCYMLFGRANAHTAPGGTSAHEQLKTNLVSYVRRVGLALVMDQEKDGEMVQSLLDLKKRLDELVRESFENTSMFVNGMTYAFSSFVNARENKPAELVAKFLDGILRTGNKSFSEEELETTLDQALTLFRFIDGKDVFEAFYKRDLSKRLLFDKSASHDLEKAMISKLKAECGSQFTSKLEAMFRDVDASKDLIVAYRQQSRHRAESDDGNKLDTVDLAVSVLEASRWPQTTQRADIKLPDQLIRHQESYKQFYLSRHAGRKLTWQHYDGSCVVNAAFPKGTKILSLSLYQTVVIVLFNTADEISYKEIAAATGIEEKELKRTLLSLACGKVRVLQKVPKGPRVADTDNFVYNKAFEHKQRRIKVNAIQMKETVEENAGTTERVFQERSHQIDAYLVRIMKTRKTLQHSALISEVYNQLRFPYKTADIKRRIESLIEREYIERDENNPQTYIYLA